MMYDGAVTGNSAGARIDGRAGRVVSARYRLWRRRLHRSNAGDRRRLQIAVAAAVQLACTVFFLVAVFRAHLEAPPTTFLLRDRHARFLGEVGAPADGELGYWPVENAAAAGDRGHPGARGPAFRLPSRRRSAGGGAGRAPEPSQPAAGLRGLHPGDADRAHAEPGRPRLPAQGRRGAHRRLPDGALRPRGDPPPLPADRALRQPHPRHRLRRPALLRQAGRRPELGRDRASSPASRRRRGR